MKKRVFILIIAAGIFYTFLSAAEKNNYEQQKADFKSMLELYKNKLRKYHNNNKKTDPYKYPLYVPEKEDLIYIYDEEGKNNYYLEHTIHKEIEEIWDDNGRIKVVSWMPKWAYDIYWSSKKKNKTGTFNFPNDSRSWVTVSGEIRDYFLINNKLPKNITSTVAHEKVSKLLGLNPPYNKEGKLVDRVFVEFWIPPERLYRPTRTVSLKEGSIHDNTWRIKSTDNPDTAQYHEKNWIYTIKPDAKKSEWIETDKLPLVPIDHPEFEESYILPISNMLCLWGSPAKGAIYKNTYVYDLNYHLLGDENDNFRGEYSLPFTALGYTFNWDNFSPKTMNDKKHKGMSEFVVKGNTGYELDGVYKTLDYITIDEPLNIIDGPSSETLRYEKNPPINIENKVFKEAS